MGNISSSAYASLNWPLSLAVNDPLDAQEACTFNHDPTNLPINNKPIDKIIHHFWLKTNKSVAQSKEIPEEEFNKLLNQYSKVNVKKECFNIDYYLNNPKPLHCPSQKYYHYLNQNNFQKMFWVNNEVLYPITVNKLKSIGVTVNNINVLKDKVLWINKINYYIDKTFYGSMVDTLKFEVVKNYGGVATDLNFLIATNNLGRFFDSYSFITLNRGIGKTIAKIENFFIAAHKNHPILNEMSAHINNMIFNEHSILPCFQTHNCTDSELTNITYGEWGEVIKSHIYDEGSVNEIFTTTCSEGSSSNPAPFMIGADEIAVGSWR